LEADSQDLQVDEASGFYNSVADEKAIDSRRQSGIGEDGCRK